jgi:alpha-ketoglutarate-dependent taurine dioxygenase
MSSVLKAEHRFARVDLRPRIASELVAGKDTLLSGEISAEIRRLLEQRGVVAFRQLNLTDAEQIAFTKTLGPISELNKDKVSKITIDPLESPAADYIRGAFYWHIDGSMLDIPIGLAILTGRRLSTVGGQTEFANTYAAYEDLSAGDKAAIEKLKVVHLMEASQRYVTPEPTYAQFKDWQRFPPRTLPLVWTHRSGRKSLVLGSTASHIEGMDLREGWALLTRLRDWATQPQFVYRHEWTVGDMVIWDNSGTMHRAIQYPLDSGRMMHRTQIAGEESIA